MAITPPQSSSLCATDATNRGCAISVRGLSVRYGDLLALEDVNVDIGWGTMVGVIGPNGAGKSTFLKAILDVVPHQAADIRIAGLAQREGKKLIAYVPQREDVHWDFPVTVEDVALMGCYGRLGLLGRPGAKQRELAHWALAQVNMLDRRTTQISQLSGGQQQRVFLARALVQQGKIMILDEPLNGVDASTQETILHLLDEFRKKGGTVLMATHDLDTAARVCDDLCCINHTLVAFGPTREVFTPTILARTYGGKITHIHGEHDIIIGELGPVGVNPQHLHEHPQLIPQNGDKGSDHV
jgi:manganese/zinc/iron transport system ATP- binding protein